jgi:hypothetical protein
LRLDEAAPLWVWLMFGNIIMQILFPSFLDNIRRLTEPDYMPTTGKWRYAHYICQTRLLIFRFRWHPECATTDIGCCRAPLRYNVGWRTL